MAVPTTREEFEEYCLRKLGAPVVDINIDPEQIDDVIDDALLKFRDFHFDGIEHVYEKHLVTQADINARVFTLDPSIVGVVRIFDVGESTNIHSLFNLRYQIRMNDLYDFAGRSTVPYVMAMRHIETLQETFVGKKPIRWNRHTRQLHVDFDWTADIIPGEYVIIDCYKVIDPATYTSVWNDPWLKRYAAALMKRQWGTNLKKFQGIPLLGGIVMNGQQIYDEAVKEIFDLEEELRTSWSLSSLDMTGSVAAICTMLSYFIGSTL